MSSWAGFTDEELSRLRQQNALGDGDAPGGRKKATINTVKKQRPREKIRSRTPSSDVKVSLYRREQNAEDQSALSGEHNTTASNSSEKSASRLNSKEEERENSSPECERRAKKKQIPEEAPPKRNGLKKTDDHLENKIGESDSGVEKDVISDLPEIIDESDR